MLTHCIQYSQDNSLIFTQISINFWGKLECHLSLNMFLKSLLKKLLNLIQNSQLCRQTQSGSAACWEI